MRRREIKETPVVSDLISQTQAAELAGAHRNTMARWLAEDPNAPQPVSHVGKSRKYSRRQIVAWIKHGPAWEVIEGSGAPGH